MTTLIPDRLHIHQRGFGSFYNFLNQNELTSIFVGEHDELKTKYGNYSNVKEQFLIEYELLVNLDKNSLFHYELYNFSVFLMAKAEILTYVFAKEHWYSSTIPQNDEFIFNKLYNEDRETLLLNMAVSIFWLNYWKKKLSFRTYKKIDYAFIFSGSLIYSKTLLNLLENTTIKPYVLEHFFTGNDFYFENKHTHSANNTNLKYNNIYDQERILFDNLSVYSKNTLINNAFNRIKNSKNKNVIQPKKTHKKLFDNQNKTVLILGQVVNDFSIIETFLNNINSIDVYKQTISMLISETNYNIIFKAHPWEAKKANLKKSLTKNVLENTFNSNRLVIVEDYNIEELFEESNFIIGLCSQALIEATLKGKKVHQFGDAFFGNKGFTYDYNSIEELIHNLERNDVTETLTLTEYNHFQTWLAITFKHLNNINDPLNIFYNYFKKKRITGFQSNKQKDILPKKNIDHLVRLFITDKKFKKYMFQRKQFIEDIQNPILRFIGKIMF